VGFLFPVSLCFYLMLSVDVIRASEVLAYTGILGLSGVSWARKCFIYCEPWRSHHPLQQTFGVASVRLLMFSASHRDSRGTGLRRL